MFTFNELRTNLELHNLLVYICLVENIYNSTQINPTKYR